jgi:dTDP-4-amino-4,6-dideoxygalactose transaminase
MVVEDCAQAAGLNIQGKQAGTWGDAGAFSFYPTKNLFALGDGGAISTSKQKIHEVARSISRYGTELGNKYLHTRLGQNSRLDTIQAAFLDINLDFLDEWNKHRRRTADIYDSALTQFKQNSGPPKSNIYHHYVIYVEKRDELKTALQKIGIGTEIHYPRVAAEEVFSSSNDYPVASLLSSTGLSLPLSPWQSLEETRYVIDSVLRLA